MGSWIVTETMTIAFENSPSVADLQLQLRNAEVALRLKSLDFRDTGVRKFTKAVFEVTTDTSVNTLRLLADPDGNAPAAADENPVCRGTAAIGLQSTKVAAFRKKPPAPPPASGT